MEDRFGRAVLVGVAKMTFAVSPVGEVLTTAEPSPIRLNTEYYPENSRFPSIHYPSDAAPEKPGTDVLFVGSAYPAAGKEPTQQDVSLRVGSLFKSIRVFGQRAFSASVLGRLAPGPAEPLNPTPLRYELAFGGFDDTDPAALELVEHNPAGRGLVATRRKQLGVPAHRLEPLASANTDGNGEPAGFGAIDVGWQPRRQRAGTHDHEWQRKRAPIAPEDFDPRFYCSAHPDLWSEQPLRGDEPVEVLGATPAGVWRFKLPLYAPRFISTRDGDQYEHPTHLDTFLIDGDRGVVELTWRAAVLLPNKAQRLERITVCEVEALPNRHLRPVETTSKQESA